ncbi:MAG: hypothetical protein IJM30_07880 [Thermoguttaceae bacterium]|nr:hypothetical protein [Thermoguttaceae bacterium]
MRFIIRLVLVVALYALVIGGCVARINFCSNVDENSWVANVLAYLLLTIFGRVVFFSIAGICSGEITLKDMWEWFCQNFSITVGGDEDFEDWF